MYEAFNLHGKNALVLGGSGALGGAIARALHKAGAHVSLTSRTLEKAAASAAALGPEARGYAMDAMQRASVAACAAAYYADAARLDILVNAIGGNLPEATTSPEQTFFDLPESALAAVVNMNLFGGAIFPAQEFGRRMAGQHEGGVIIHVSSMAAMTPLTRIPGYNAAKAAVENFTRWLAVHLAQEYSPLLRVNAIAPGFFLTEQNAFLLREKDTGAPTPRGRSILAHTPMARFGEAEDIGGAVVFLASDAARFITGAILPVDGGFSAFSGV
jgi:NAD(P)-dependent dehydrogenase (short-subunit alcohol dehydrogenase family)